MTPLKPWRVVNIRANAALPARELDKKHRRHGKSLRRSKLQMTLTLQQMTFPEDYVLRHSLQPIKAKFLKYWSDIPEVSIIATCLDLRLVLSNIF
jgi:hypothetical protein